MKTFLAAVGLLVGTGAWAQTTAFSQDFTAVGESTDPSDYGFALTYGAGSSSSLVNFTVTGGVLQCVAGPYASSSDGARTGTATATFSTIGTGNEVNISYTWALGNATGNTTGSYTKTRIGNSSGNALELSFYGAESNGSLKVNGTTVKSGNSAIRNTTYTVTATLNMNTQKITALTMTCSNSTYSYTASEAIDFASSITSVDRFAFENSERQNWANTSSIDNVSITYEEAKESVESFVVNYKYGETVITTENVATAGLYTGDSYTVPFRMYVSKDGALYKTTANGSDYYHDVITLTTNTVVNKSLTAVDLGGGTLELLEDLDDASGENASVRASYGLSYNNKSYTSDVTLIPGVYTFIFRAQNKGRGSSVKVGETTVCGIGEINSTSGTWTDKTFTGVEIYTAGNVTLVKGGNNTIDCYDIIIAIRTGDVTTSVTVTDAGYATYVNSDYDLDFSATGIKAYKVKVNSKGKATMTQVDNVPSGTPILLYKDGGATENIPITTGAAAVDDNDLVAGTGATVATTDGDYTNMILNVVDEKVGFYFANGQTVATNRAYLHILTTLAPAAASAPMMLVFDDNNTTGIDAALVNSEQRIENNVYDLQGRKVAQPVKGLYIMNGRKVVIK